MLDQINMKDIISIKITMDRLFYYFVEVVFIESSLFEMQITCKVIKLNQVKVS